jgi:hypothetical protein
MLIMVNPGGLHRAHYLSLDERVVGMFLNDNANMDRKTAILLYTIRDCSKDRIR